MRRWCWNPARRVDALGTGLHGAEGRRRPRRTPCAIAAGDRNSSRCRASCGSWSSAPRARGTRYKARREPASRCASTRLHERRRHRRRRCPAGRSYYLEHRVVYAATSSARGVTDRSEAAPSPSPRRRVSRRGRRARVSPARSPRSSAFGLAPRQFIRRRTPTRRGLPYAPPTGQRPGCRRRGPVGAAGHAVARARRIAEAEVAQDAAATLGVGDRRVPEATAPSPNAVAS